MRIELYFSPWCTACGNRSLRDSESGNTCWIDVTKHLEAAARLRITRLPAWVVDGRLVAQGPQALARLRTLASSAQRTAPAAEPVRRGPRGLPDPGHEGRRAFTGIAGPVAETGPRTPTRLTHVAIGGRSPRPAVTP